MPTERKTPEKTEQRLRRLKRHASDQRKLVAELIRDGRPATEAIELLVAFDDAVRLAEHQQDLIAAALDRKS